MFSAFKAGVTVSKVSYVYTVTQGTDSVPSGTGYGFMNAAVAGKLSTSAFGSIDNTSFGGETIAAMFYNDAITDTFDVYLEGNVSNGAIATMVVEGVSTISTIFYGGHDAGSDTTLFFGIGSNDGTWDGSGPGGVTIT